MIWMLTFAVSLNREKHKSEICYQMFREVCHIKRMVVVSAAKLIQIGLKIDLKVQKQEIQLFNLLLREFQLLENKKHGQKWRFNETRHLNNFCDEFPIEGKHSLNWQVTFFWVLKTSN